ncbi:cytochrome d ubiquinol oxidase subunit II [Desertibacillus haloalkaliphilus]|uniref:cytochrome d ubiquinol oxidase subunit II n=1 Tax=Desertibacillus haloalkaliphilus TaxID=1328930 RepID=UPI001C278B2D|nr:cytochrome d ubiquinol oxidase subunit II [Desertibacillus haloalkaliphilus]MBU8907898.1 cytochrome d ubiquinol oxidase subunit II [Desertibacillus haloalkaliphilus]
MGYELIGITILWIFLYGYVIVASIDFGAGFFHFFSKLTNRNHRADHLIQRYLSPVWEVTNVFLVFFFVGIVAFFPETAFYFGTALLVPMSVTLLLLIFRGSYYAFGTYGANERLFYSFLYGSTGLLIPASLSVVLTVAGGGYIVVEHGEVSLLTTKLLTSPYSWSVIILAIVSVLFISATFLSNYASKARDLQALHLLRNYALTWAAPTIAASVMVLVFLRDHNPSHFQKMMDIGWVFGASLGFFLIAVYLLEKGKKLGLAFICVMIQYAFAFFGYGISHLPFLLYPHVSIYDGFTNDAMARALLLAFVAGLLLLLPSLYLLMRLFLFTASYVKGDIK